MARRSGNLDRPAHIDPSAAPASRHAELVRALRSQGDEEGDRSLFFAAGGRNLAEQKAARSYAIRLQQHLNTTLPESVRRLLRAHIRSMYAYTTSAGTIHRGEPSATKGLYNWDERHLEVFEPADHVPEDTVRHEIGHALDHAMAAARNIDQERMMQVRQARRHAALSNTRAFQRLYAQYRHDVPDGWSSSSEEMFAEGFAMFHGPQDQRAWLERKAPGLYHYFENLQEEMDNFVREAKTSS